MAEKFASNEDVLFGDSKSGSLAPGVGAGGWPTVRYYNKATGKEGKAYVQKTQLAMCSELGGDAYNEGTNYLEQFVMEAGSTSLCSIATGKGCSEKEKKFIAKWKRYTKTRAW